MKTSQRTRVYPVKPLGLMNQEVVLIDPRYDPFEVYICKPIGDDDHRTN
jgi:hypothetical protein